MKTPEKLAISSSQINQNDLIYEYVDQNSFSINSSNLNEDTIKR